MKTRNILYPILFLLAFIFFTGPGMSIKGQQSDQTNQFIGTWLGTLKVSANNELRISFEISKDDDGIFIAVMKSLDQGGQPIPADQVSEKNGVIFIGIKAIGGEFEGKINEDGSAIEGKWKQSGMSIPLILKPVDELPDR